MEREVVEFIGEAILDCELSTSDPYLAYVVLLMSFEGTHGSTTGTGFVDDSPSHHPNPGAGGTSHIDTSTYRFGGSSY
jgi:hypothetical protein